MDVIHGKPIDIARLKKPVLSGLQTHLDKIKNIATYLAERETPVGQNQCYICGSTERKPFGTVHGFDYVECAQCSLVYTTQRYTEEAIKRFYAENEYYSQITYANKETCFYRREHVARPKVEFLERYLAAADKGVWIDIGSGIGDLVSVVTGSGWEAVGLEISASSVRFAQETFQVELTPQTFEEYCAAHPEMKGTVGVISCIGLLEHVVNPMEHLRLAYEMLKPDGLIMVQGPNAHSAAAMLQMVFPGNVFRHMSPIEHIMAFTPQSLTTALENSEFEPLAFWYHGLDVYELLNNLILVNERVQDSDFYRIMMENMNELQLVFDEKELSDRLICVTRKHTD